MNWPGAHARRLTTLEGVSGAYLVAALCMALAVVLLILEACADLVMWVKNKCTPCNSSLKCSLARISALCGFSCSKEKESEHSHQKNKQETPKSLWPEAALKEVQDITDLVDFAAPLTMIYHRLNESNAALTGLRSAVLIQQQQQPASLHAPTQTQTGELIQMQTPTKTQTQIQMSSSRVARPTVIKQSEISVKGDGHASQVFGAPVQTLPWTRNSASLEKKSSFVRSFSSAIGLPGLFATTTAPNYAVKLPPLMQPPATVPLKEPPRSTEHRASLASLMLPSLQDLDDALPELANVDRTSMRQRGKGCKTEDPVNGNDADESTGEMPEPGSMKHLQEQKEAPTRSIFVDQTQASAAVVHSASPDAAKPSVLQRSLDSYALQQLRDRGEMQQEAFSSASKAELGFLAEIVRGTNTQATGYQRAQSSASEASSTAVEEQRLEQQKGAETMREEEEAQVVAEASTNPVESDIIKQQEAATEAAAKAKTKQEEEQQAAVAEEEAKAKQRLDEAKEEQLLAAQEAQARTPKILNPKQQTLTPKQ
jgi:hypothetical protein